MNLEAHAQVNRSTPERRNRQIKRFVSTASAVLVTLSGVGSAAAQTAQTITAFNPPASRAFAQGATIALGATGGGSGNPIAFAATTPSTCSVSGSTLAVLAVGTCTVTADQAGNASFSAALQLTRTITITKGNQTIAFPAPASPTVNSTPVSLTVTASSTLPVVLASTTPAVCSLIGNNLTPILAGSCTVTADQVGNTNFTAAPQVSRTFAVLKISQTVSFVTVTAKTINAPPFAVSGIATSGLPLTFSTTSPAAVCTVANGTVTLVGVGSCSVVAAQAGDATYAAAPSITRSFNVTLAPQTITFATLPAQLVTDPPTNLVATASSGLPVAFSSTTTGACSVAGTTLTLIAAGTCTVSATQAGNAMFAAAPAVNRSFTITNPKQVITFKQIPPRSINFGPFAVTATSSAGLPVILTSNTPLVCSVAGDTVSLVRVGTCSITANQPGTSTVQAAPSVTRTFVVGLEKQVVIFPTLTPQTLATSTINLIASATSGLPVSFATRTPTICSVSGSVVTLLAQGLCTIEATQGGNAIFAAAPVDTNSFRISKIVQTITFAVPPTTTLSTATLNLTGSASSALPVSFTASPSTICTVSGNVLTLVAAGRCSVTASQAGDTKWNLAPNVTRVFTITKIAQTISFTAVPTTALSTATVALSATTSSGLPVTFTSRTAAVCTVIGNQVTLIKVGACTIAANQAGDATYLAVPQAVRSFTVNTAGLIAQTITGFNPPTTFVYAPNTTIPISATGGSSGNPVTFSSNTTTVCTVSGSTVTLLSAGSCVVTADQAGSTTRSAAAQVVATINVTPATQSVAFGSVSSKVSSDPPFSISASSSSALPVVVTSTTPTICTVTNFLVTLLRDGQCVLSGDQTGNDNYQAAPTASLSFAVAPGTAAQRIVSVSAGAYHACALTDAGGIQCWGFNGSGQLGNGTTTNQPAPVDVIGLGGVATAVAAGLSRTCALLSTGEIRCWGSNGSGALGDGTTIDRLTPVLVNTGGLAATKLATGGNFSCAIFVNGETRCWGNNDFGQLGDSTGTNSLSPVGVVELGGSATAIQAGFYNACAQVSGSWKCWGYNVRSYQPLGVSQFEVMYAPEARPQWGFNPAAVSLGQLHSCGLTTSGGAKCWGYAAYGQLGDGVSTPIQPIPVDVSGLAAGNTAVAAGSYSSCGLTAAGGVKCWGSGYAQTATNVVGATSGIVAVSAGDGFACGVTNRGGVRCWGSNAFYGQIGRDVVSIPADADYVTGLNDRVALSQTIMFSNPGPRAFGDAPFALAATASSGLVVSLRSATASVCTVANGLVTLLDGGVCTIIASQPGGPMSVGAPEVSQTFVVGNNQQSQTISNFAPPSSVDYFVRYFNVSANSGASGIPVVFTTSTPNICRVVTGFVTLLDTGNCVITASQLGNAFFSAATPITATVTINAPPTLADRIPQTLTRYGPGSPFTFYGQTQAQLVIQSNGSVNPIRAVSTTPSVCTVASDLWVNILSVGSCQISASQAGNGKYAPAQTVFVIDVIDYVPPPPSIVGAALGVGTGHACAVSSTGGLRCWGANAFGQLGDASTANRNTPVDVIGITTSVVAVAGGGSHTCMLTSAGGVRCWGANDRGQLGNGSNTPSLTPVDVLGLSTGVLDITVGNAHSCAYMQDGALKCWGAGTNGAIGDGAGLDRNFPVYVIAAGSGNVDLRAGGQHTCAVAANGSVKCWGDNSAGQLGDGTNAAFQLSPATVSGLSGAAIGIEAGGLHTCALLAGGGVQCWGANSNGQLGTGDNIGQPLPAGVSGLTAGATSIAIGRAASCAIVNAGGVKCWGDVNNTTSPTDVAGLDSLTAELGVGGAFACALNSNGLVSCWGDNTFGQLGDATNTAKSSAVPVSGFVAGSAPTKSAQSIAFNAVSTTALSQSAVNLNATATSGLPVAISSLDTTVCTVAGGVATLLAVGNCQLVANQGGNISFFAAPQVSQSFQVTSSSGQSVQTISGFTLPTTIAAGSTASLTATGGASANPVVFTSLSPTNCSVFGNTLTGLASGLCTVAANQAGNAGYLAAPQATATTAVGLLPQTITGFAPATPMPFVANGTFVLSASGGASSNPVTFASTTANVCTVSGNTASVLTAGTCTLTANQTGNATYAAASQVTVNVVIGKMTQSINFPAISDLSISATPPALSATASSRLPVTFSTASPAVCTVNGATATLLSTGICAINADQPGDMTFAPALQIQRTFTVSAATLSSQVISGFAPPSPISYRPNGTFTVSAMGGASGIPVVFAAMQFGPCTVSGDTVTIVGSGTCVLTANQAGNATYNPAIEQVASVVITAADQRISFASIGSQSMDTNQFGLIASSSAGLPLTFTTLTPSTCGTLFGNVSLQNVGTCTIAADQPGNSNYNAAPQVQQSFVISQGAQTIFNLSTPDSGYFFAPGGTFAVSAIGGRSGNPIIFAATTPEVCSIAGSVVSMVATGTCAITADQLGNPNFTAAQQAGIFVQILLGSQTITFNPLPDRFVGDLPFTISATSSAGLPVEFETVTTTVCRITGATVTILAAGICNVSANQFGNLNFAFAGTVFRSFVVTQLAQSAQVITGFAPPSQQLFSSGGTFSLSALGGASSNSVIFATSTQGICSVNGSTVTMLAVGTCNLTANQAGNALYSPAAQVIASVVFYNVSVSTMAPFIVTPVLDRAILGLPYAANLVLGSPSPVLGLGVAGLPAGVNGIQNAAGTILLGGAPTSAGRFTTTVSASNNVGSMTAPVAIDVDTPISNPDGIAAGLSHSCALQGGGVLCWGSNSSGQLGDGSTVSSGSPVVALALGGGATAISAGSNGSCAVVSGGVQCWGNGVLQSTTIVPSDSGVTAIASGSSHSCAVVAGGVQCWGSNTNAQLGNGSTLASAAPVTAIVAGSGATAVAAGGIHTCAIVNGGVQCWGSNNLNALGTASGGSQSTTPVSTIAAGSGATAIAIGADPLGADHTCAVVAGGVRCWGYNGYWQLGGPGSTDLRVVVPAGSNATAIAAGVAHTCAVIAGGIQCWGWNSNGQLGDGDSTPQVSVFQPPPTVALPAASSATMVTGGAFHTCAVINGVVSCWGNNNGGQVGNTRPPQNRTPFSIHATGANATAIAAGLAHTCLVINGGVQCWGDNARSQLGNPNLKSGPAIYATFPDNSNVSAISSGDNHSCALVGGVVHCWGSNQSGQLSNGVASFHPTAASVIVDLGGAVPSVLAAGSNHSCAVVNGGVQCWGGNNFGQLGDGSTTQRSTPATVAGLSALSGATSVSAGSVHSCAVVNGGAQCWGNNDSGTLGDGSTTPRLAPVSALAANSGVRSIAAGSSHTCAVVSAGVRCWGLNTNGQLGNNTNTQSSVAVTAIPANSATTAVAVGQSHSCAVVDGGVQCWGNNSEGQLGNGSVATTAVPIQTIQAGAGVTAITAGHTHTCVVINGGSLCWGSNGSGQIGSLASYPLRKVVPVFGVAPVISAPAAPTLATATANINGATLTFTAPANTGGAAITSYTATCSTATNPAVNPARSSTVQVSQANPNPTSITVTNMTDGLIYNCSVVATNSIGASVASNELTVTINTPPAPPQPTISITAPANNAKRAQPTTSIFVNAPTQPIPPISIVASATGGGSGGSGTISSITILDGTTVIDSLSPTTAYNAITYETLRQTAALGTHTITARVTNSQGTTVTSNPITINVLAPPTVTLATISNYYPAGGGIDLAITAAAAATSGTPAGTASIASVEVVATNTATNVVIPIATIGSPGNPATPPYSLRWTNVPAGTYTVTAKATDSEGISAVTTPVSITVSNALSIAAAPTLNGSTVSEDTLTLIGTYLAPPNSAVTVNGRLATLNTSGQFFINGVLLNIGANTLTLIVTTQDGATNTQTITINRVQAPGTYLIPAANGNPAIPPTVPTFSFTVGKGGMIAVNSPLNVTVNTAITNNVSLGANAIITLSCDDPQAGNTVLALGDYVCPYTRPGDYVVRLTVSDATTGLNYTTTRKVKMENPLEKIALVKGVYADMIDRLQTSNKAMALNLFFGHAQEQYDDVFTKLDADLAMAASQLGVIARVNVHEDSAEAVLMRIASGVTRTFSILLLRGEDGIWRIESM